MKLFLKSFAVATTILILYSMIPFSAQCSSISNEVFRLHILANSDTKQDQSLKLKVRDALLEYTSELYENCDSVYQAQSLTNSSLQDIANVAAEVVKENGYDYPVKAEVKEMYFDTRCYENVTMPSGIYEALRITIGKGEGHNWWCVMYPSLCVGASTNYDELKENTSEDEYNIMTSEGYSYQFKIVEYFEKICSFFS